MSFSTPIFTIESKTMIKKIASRWIAKWSPFIILVLFATAIASAFDLRFIYILLIEIFILAPMTLMNIWIVYGMKPRVARSIIPHRIHVGKEMLKIEYQNDEKFEKNQADDIIYLNELKNVVLDNKYIALIYGRRPNEIELIPTSCFMDASEIKRFIGLIYPSFNDNSLPL